MSENLDDLAALAGLTKAINAEANAINQTKENPKPNEVINVDAKGIIAKGAHNRNMLGGGASQAQQAPPQQQVVRPPHNDLGLPPELLNAQPLTEAEMLTDGFEDEFGAIEIPTTPQPQRPPQRPQAVPMQQPQQVVQQTPVMGHAEVFPPNLQAVIFRKLVEIEKTLAKLVKQNEKPKRTTKG